MHFKLPSSWVEPRQPRHCDGDVIYMLQAKLVVFSAVAGPVIITECFDASLSEQMRLRHLLTDAMILYKHPISLIEFMDLK